MWYVACKHRILRWYVVHGIYYWGVPIIRGRPLFGSPCNKDPGILRFVLRPLWYGNSHLRVSLSGIKVPLSWSR